MNKKSEIKEYRSDKKYAQNFVNLILDTSLTKKSEKKICEYTKKLDNNIGLWHIYKKIKQLVYDANNKNNKKLIKKLNKIFESLKKESLDLSGVPENFKHIKKNNREFFYKIAFIYQIAYDNATKSRKIDKINKQIKDYKKKSVSANKQITYVSSGLPPDLDPNFEKNQITDVQKFFELFLNDFNDNVGMTKSELDIYNKQVVNYCNKLKDDSYTPYICNYIFDNIKKLWSTKYGLNDFHGHYDLQKVKEIAPELYKKIDILCSIIYIIKNSNDKIEKEIHNSSEGLDEVHQNISDVKNTLDNEITNQKKDIESKITNQKEDIESKITNQKENILSEIKSLIYPEIITILGIFTAITFAIFGGMNLLSNLFQNIRSTHASLGQALILVSIFGFTLWGLIEILFIWISRINLTNDDKDHRDDKKEDKEEKKIDKKKKIFNWFALSFLTVILIMGFMLFFF